MLPRTVADCRAAEERGEQIEYLMFWGHHPAADGHVTAACLSQWWEAPFSADGIEYRTAEHAMMAAKARLFGDDEALARVLDAPHPSAAKAVGREVRGFDSAVWEAHRYAVVVAANVAKFGAHPELGAYLRGTRARVLVEASPVDRIWGIGLAATDEQAARATTWRGLNLLGFALMDARDVLEERA
jgi:ribA/ribD-fused uncharacterized protein